MFAFLRSGITKLNVRLGAGISSPRCISCYVTIGIIFLIDRSPVRDLLNSEVNDIVEIIFLWFAIQSLVGMIHFILLRSYMLVSRTKIIQTITDEKRKRETTAQKVLNN